VNHKLAGPHAVHCLAGGGNGFTLCAISLSGRTFPFDLPRSLRAKYMYGFRRHYFIIVPIFWGPNGAS
jgi:hypothetical protein